MLHPKRRSIFVTFRYRMVNARFHSATIGALRAAARDRQHTKDEQPVTTRSLIVVGEASLHKRCPRRLSPVTNALPASLGCHREFEGREQSSHAYRQYESSLPRTKHRGAWLGTLRRKQGFQRADY